MLNCTSSLMPLFINLCPDKAGVAMSLASCLRRTHRFHEMSESNSRARPGTSGLRSKTSLHRGVPWSWHTWDCWPISFFALATHNCIPGNFANPEKVFAEVNTGNESQCRTVMKVEPDGCGPPRVPPEKWVAMLLLLDAVRIGWQTHRDASQTWRHTDLSLTQISI